MAIGAALFVDFYAQIINNGTARRAEYLYPFDPSKPYEPEYDVLYRAV